MVDGVMVFVVALLVDQSRKFDNNSYGKEQDVLKITIDNVKFYTIYYENEYIINTS